ncbi:putative FAD-binding dehydrogenase [Limihaloglobus sulfuriphilus]|uniref:Putative FAD-binding dehydrogenase n=1 Tax=Limihaloglobus sulfuriphilus TaxID=1851148 RepID=A0A1Q2MIJ5_9BACT|nr:FAD-dependent oxidoreductase [Limihaloglobus sulfuriphilus]AQQ72484.1 putative FAD-binding dehydrogenase [Limihaloglobus sulfuriphilus]
MSDSFKTIEHKVDFCVVGGGLSGMCAAIAAARNGLKVAIMQDRPVFGGNCSSEIRMWICGARGRDNKETGLVEEFMLENLYRNPNKNYSIWDSILFEKVRYEPNITTMLLNCSCNNAEMDGSRIESVRGWQGTTQSWHIVRAKIFADCSGDSVLAPLTGAQYRVGREAKTEFNEDIGPEEADNNTMGSSCLIQAREMPTEQPFTPPAWAYKYTSCDDFKHRTHNLSETQNFWWIEIGGRLDTIADAETIRDELLKIVYGAWDHIKNHCEKKEQAKNWAIDWVGMLPGKRESRRYVGDYIMTQHDVESEGRFDDLVAFGGWPMDDHHPGGFSYTGDPTYFYNAPSPYGIPYRCLYSKNIDNLYFAGRNISVTHAALSSTRVMATCSLLGQAVGTACSIAVHENITPRQVYEDGYISELKEMLMDNDCYLPWNRRDISEMSVRAELIASNGNPEQLRNGIERDIDGEENGWKAGINDWIEYNWSSVQNISEIRIIFDSNLNRMLRTKKLSSDQVNGEGDPAAASARDMWCCYPLDQKPKTVPESMVKAFRIEAKDSNGDWAVVYSETNNYQRLVKIPLNLETEAIRLIPEATWGAEQVHIFAWEVR